MVLSEQLFKDISVQAMLDLFDTSIVDVSFQAQADSPLSADEQTVAALDFSGGFCGTIALILNKKDISGLVDIFLSRYDFDSVIAAEDVLAEFLNIYASGIAAALSEYSTNIRIGPPFICPKKDIPANEATIYSLSMTSDQNVTIHFCYFIH